MDDRQPRAVVAVGVSAELMLDLMRLKIRDFADFQHAVLCHGGRPRQLCAILHLGIGGVGHDAGELHNALTLRVQDTHDPIVHAIALDRAAAIGQHDSFAKVCEQAAEVLLHAAFAEIYLGLVFKNKVIHHNVSSLTVFLAVFAAVCYYSDCYCRLILPIINTGCNNRARGF